MNTLFLLDAGLSNFQAFAANAFFTAGMVLFEVPTGIVADSWGRRASYLLGTVTLAVTTLIYLWLFYVQGPFWAWAISSALIGLGYTFFSGAVQAWLVDALQATGFDGDLDNVFARGQVCAGVGMLLGAGGGGYLAQWLGLGAPYWLRAGVLLLMFVLALLLMRDLGFTAERGQGYLREMRRITRESVDSGLRVRPVRWLMVAGFCSGGIGIYVGYALQPHLLDLWGDETAYGIAGLAAALLAAAQILGGLLTPRIRRPFRTRTGTILATSAAGTLAVSLLVVAGFWLSMVLILVWGLAGAAEMAVRQAYLNGMIPSKQRATILSFDSLMSSGGAAIAQPALGRSADVWSYPASFGISGAVSALALPFVWLSRREKDPADAQVTGASVSEPGPAAAG